MERFDQAEMAPIHAALMAIPAGHDRDMALNKACRVAQECDQRVRNGQAIEAHAEADELTKAVIGAVVSMTKREALTKAAEAGQTPSAEKPKFDLRKTVEKVAAARAALAKAGTIKPQSQAPGMKHTGPAMQPRRNMRAIKLAAMKPQGQAKPKKLDHRKPGAPTEARHKLDPEVVSKAIESLPLSKRAVAEVLRLEGDEEQLKKWLGPALMAARAALPSVARAASRVGSRLFGGAKKAGGAAKAGATAATAGAAGGLAAQPKPQAFPSKKPAGAAA